MKRLLLLSSVLAVMLIIPGLASATHFTNVVAIGDCEGFNAQIDVHFRYNADFLDLHYEVVVLDEDSMEVEMVSGDINVLHEGDPDVSFMVSDLFETVLDGVFVVSGTFTLTSPYPGGVDEESTSFENGIECGSVANDEVSFESMKAMYR
jgi:hypothetical protein